MVEYGPKTHRLMARFLLLKYQFLNLDILCPKFFENFDYLRLQVSLILIFVLNLPVFYPKSGRHKDVSLIAINIQNAIRFSTNYERISS